MPWFGTGAKARAKHPPRENLWVKCRRCGAHVFKEDWANNQKVCPKCNFHDRLTAYERIGLTLDSGTFSETFESITPGDPLAFVDAKGDYPAKVDDARAKTKLNESVVTGTGKINGIPVSMAVMDFRFLGGSLGSGTGEKILQASNYAFEKEVPLIIFSASGGARMQEGALSLMQMAKTCAGISRLNRKRIPYVSVLTDPTTGGVSASFAMVGDVNIAEPGAVIGFAGRRVIEQTINQKLPDDFQTSEFLLEHGFLDAIVNRGDMKKALSCILSYWNRN